VVAPFIVHHFAERPAFPRALAWVYLSLVVAVVLVVAGLSVFLFVSLLPGRASGHSVAGCLERTYCLYALPAWARLSLWSLAAAALAWLVGRMGTAALVAVRTSRRLRDLITSHARLLDTPGPGAAYEVADSSLYAVTFGVRRPVVLLSEGLRRCLGPRELEVVLAHEEAHIRGRDALLLTVSRVLAAGVSYVPGVGLASRRLETFLDVAADEGACFAIGDVLAVAACLGRVASLKLDSVCGGQALPGAGCTAFAGEGPVVERVRFLVGGCETCKSRRQALYSAMVLVLSMSLLGAGLLMMVAGGLLSHSSAVVACILSGQG